MSLQRLRLSLERLIPRGNPDLTPIADLESLFLTSRQCSEKYQQSIPGILNAVNPDEPLEFEQSMMWFAFKNDKPPEESVFGGNEEEEREEKWKSDWLDRMERRELGLPLSVSSLAADNLRGYRFKSSYTCFDSVTPYPIPSPNLSKAPLLPRNGNSTTDHPSSRLRISSSH